MGLCIIINSKFLYSFSNCNEPLGYVKNVGEHPIERLAHGPRVPQVHSAGVLETVVADLESDLWVRQSSHHQRCQYGIWTRGKHEEFKKFSYFTQ